jgi:hypothetical protein
LWSDSRFADLSSPFGDCQRLVPLGSGHGSFLDSQLCTNDNQQHCMTTTRLEIARWLGWLGVVAFFGICCFDGWLRNWHYGWLAYPAIPVTIFLTVLAIKMWGGKEAVDNTHKGVLEALVSFAASGVSLALLLFVGVLVLLFTISLWSLVRS